MLLYTRNAAFVWLGASDLRGCVQEALCPSLGGCLCVVFSTRGVLSVRRKSSETLEWSSFFSCLSVVPLQARERAVLGGQRRRRRSLNSSGGEGLLLVSSDRFFIKPAPSSDVWQSSHQSHTSADPLQGRKDARALVMTSLTTSGCVSHVCSPGWCWGDVRNSDRLNRAFTAAWWYMKLFKKKFLYFSPGPLSWWMDRILHVS